MTRHKAAQTGLGTPSPLDRWINAIPHGLAMLVSHVARRFAPRHPISAAECDGSCEPVREADFVLDQHQKPAPAAASSHISTASEAKEDLMLRTIALAIVDSKHEGGLTRIAPRETPPPGKGRSGLSKTNRGWGSLRPAPTHLASAPLARSEPHPDFASDKSDVSLSEGECCASLSRRGLTAV
jgi:hypothetical protein